MLIFNGIKGYLLCWAPFLLVVIMWVYPQLPWLKTMVIFYCAFMFKLSVFCVHAQAQWDCFHDKAYFWPCWACYFAFMVKLCLFYRAFTMVWSWYNHSFISGQQVSRFCLIYSYLILLLSLIITNTIFVIWYLNIVIDSVNDIRKSISLFDFKISSAMIWLL